MNVTALVTDTGIELTPDPSRVITRFFVPGREDLGPGGSRAAPVIHRILALDELEVESMMTDIVTRFADRHRSLEATFDDHATRVMSRVESDVELSTARRLLLGAAFTHEYSVEGAALCNPSAVLHPRQGSMGDASFILSVRCVGEGHRSSIGFRTGTVTTTGVVTLDPPGRFLATAEARQTDHHRAMFRAALADSDDDQDNVAFVLDSLPPTFSTTTLESRIAALTNDDATRRDTSTTATHLRELANSTYEVQFEKDTLLSERILWPQVPAEHNGLEDARFVRFVADSGDVTYYATYTAFDGVNIAQHMLQTGDFVQFTSSPLAGRAAIGKGLALFPRQIDGRYVALSRSDRETNSIAFSDDIRCWPTSETIQVPERPWEVLQLGNCGPPIETEAGWLVLTHGVGPMRTYALGAILLDLDDPRCVLGRSAWPIIVPTEGHRDGYVPNVVYSCGAFAHDDILVLPYGIADQTISIATLSVTELLATLE